MAKEEIEFNNMDHVAWQPIAPVTGLYEKILARDGATGDYTRILRFDPGADTTPLGVQRHDFWEEVFIVHGSITDLSLGQTFSAGMYACRPPGMPHGPWKSDHGCLTFEIRYFLSQSNINV
jgi:ChrR Cupin-like domain